MRYLTETWILDLCFDHRLFLDCYTVFRSHRMTRSKTYDGGVLCALPSKFCSYKHTYDLYPCNECACVEIPTLEDLNLLNGDNYITPDTESEITINYLPVL
jgi:hypothetical protein